MSKLGIANRFFFQLFFVRLTKHTENTWVTYNLTSFDITSSGIASRGTGKMETTQWYSIQYWILPFTGWQTDFIYLGNKSPRYWQITKKIILNNT
jgi:hypothetical protein